MFCLIGVFVIFSFASCGNPPYRGKDVLGADEFVMDSYRIREGKFAILEMEGKCFEPLSEDLLKEYADVIQEGDILKISFYHPTRSDISASIHQISENIGYRVNNGIICLPDLNPIEVQGLTLDEAKEKIRAEYLKHIHDVDIFLAYKDRTQRKVEMMGLVSLPTLAVDGRIRLFETLSLTKVPPNANFFKSYIVREKKLLPVDLYKLIKEGDMTQNIVMRGGDKIYIAEPSATTIMVLGEVGKERVVDLPNGFMTVRQAIAEAGGIPFTGDRRYIQIIRGNILHPKIYSLNWKHVIHLPSDSLLLIPGDIVYVAATPIAEWNRFVNQILPTLIGFDLLTNGAKRIGVNVNE